MFQQSFKCQITSHEKEYKVENQRCKESKSNFESKVLNVISQVALETRQTTSWDLWRLQKC